MGNSRVFDRWDAWLAERRQRRALSEFSCAHCERNARCGRPPREDCIEKLDQIARDDAWRYRGVVSGGVRGRGLA